MRTLSLIITILLGSVVFAQTEPIYYESFDRCIDAEDENYGYTGGNDNLWGGDIAKAYAIYQDSPEWSFTYVNGANQCIKVGTSQKQGSATTPLIACSGEATLTFRAAPWEGDSLFNVSVQGGNADQTSFNLKKHQWNDITIHITDITSGIRVTFTSTLKHRFFLDEVKVFPADPSAPVIRTNIGTTVDFGLLGRYYTTTQRTISVSGINLRGNISATIDSDADNLFSVSPATLPANGGELTITCKSGASVDMHGAYLTLKAQGTDNTTVQKRVMLTLEVLTLDLEGSGTKEDPYTVSDVLLLAQHDGTVYANEMYWVTGYILGGVKRYNNVFDGISQTDNLSLVLAQSPDESNMDNIITVQIGHDARAALNVVDNPELVGQQVKVQGTLLSQGLTSTYLGKTGVKNVNTNEQYVLPGDISTALPQTQQDDTRQLNPDQPMYDILGRPVTSAHKGIVIQHGTKYLLP